MTGWVNRRSTRTTTVFACLLLTTSPCNTRFGIYRLLKNLSSSFGGRGALALRSGLDPGDVAADLANARRVCKLPGRSLDAPVELLFLELDEFIVQLVWRHRPEVIGFKHRSLVHLLGNALDKTRPDRKLGRGEVERLARERRGNAVDLEQDAARLDPHHPQFRRALAGAHADLERLLRNRHVRIDADPHPAGALHVAGHGAPRRLDLACGHPVRLHRLEAELTKAQRRAAGGGAFDPAFVRLAKLGTHRLQHGTSPLSDFQPTLMPQLSRRGRPDSLSAMRLSCAIGSCSRISPLKIHTLTPQVP